MASGTIIGRGAHVRGRVSGAGDLQILGRVDGDVAVDGEVVIEGLVGANVTAKRIVARGAVKGDLVADEAVLLEEGARVVGDVRAPRIAIGGGALVRGYVQTGGAEGAPLRAKSQASRTMPQARPAAPARPVPARAEVAKKAAPPPPRGATLAGRAPAKALVKGPPPPVVPVLKKGARGALKKKAG